MVKPTAASSKHQPSWMTEGSKAAAEKVGQGKLTFAFKFNARKWCSNKQLKPTRKEDLLWYTSGFSAPDVSWNCVHQTHAKHVRGSPLHGCQLWLGFGYSFNCVLVSWLKWILPRQRLSDKCMFFDYECCVSFRIQPTSINNTLSRSINIET